MHASICCHTACKHSHCLRDCASCGICSLQAGGSYLQQRGWRAEQSRAHAGTSSQGPPTHLACNLWLPAGDEAARCSPEGKLMSCDPSEHHTCAGSCADLSAGNEEATVSLTGAGMQMFEFDGEVEFKTTVLSISEEPAALELTIFSRTNKQHSLEGVVFIKPTTYWAMHRSAFPVQAMSMHVTSPEWYSSGHWKR